MLRQRKTLTFLVSLSVFQAVILFTAAATFCFSDPVAAQPSTTSAPSPPCSPRSLATGV